jgi:hypothetical protein
MSPPYCLPLVFVGGLDLGDFRSLIRRWKASWYESWSFQFLKSGMKYSRTSLAESFPVSASKHCQNYCSYPALEKDQKDPQSDPIRQRPEFGELPLNAVQCQQKFLTHRERVDGALAVAQ